MTRPVKPCGTNAAYQRHRAAGEPPCDPCRDAALAVSREKHDRYRAQQAAYDAALHTLRRAHPTEWADLKDAAYDRRRAEDDTAPNRTIHYRAASDASNELRRRYPTDHAVYTAHHRQATQRQETP